MFVLLQVSLPADDMTQAELNRSLEQSDVALSSESLPVSDLRDSSSTQP